MYVEDDIREMVASSKSGGGGRSRVKQSPPDAAALVWDTVPPTTDSKVADVIGHLGRSPKKKRSSKSRNSDKNTERKSKTRKRDGDGVEERKQDTERKSSSSKPKRRLEGRRTKTIPVVAPDSIMVDHKAHEDEIVSLVSIPKAIRDGSSSSKDKKSKKEKKREKRAKKLPPTPPGGLYDKRRHHKHNKEIKEGIPHVKNTNTSLLGDSNSESSAEEELFSGPLGLAVDGHDSDESTFVDPDFLPKDYEVSKDSIKTSKNSTVSELLQVNELARQKSRSNRTPKSRSDESQPGNNKTNDLLQQERSKTRATIELPRKPYNKPQKDMFKLSAVEEIAMSDPLPPPPPARKQGSNSSRKNRESSVEDIDRRIEKAKADIERKAKKKAKEAYVPDLPSSQFDGVEGGVLAGSQDSDGASGNLLSRNGSGDGSQDSGDPENKQKEKGTRKSSIYGSLAASAQVEPHIAALMESLAGSNSEEDEEWEEDHTTDTGDFKLPDPEEILTPTAQLNQQRTIIPSQIGKIDSGLLLVSPGADSEQAQGASGEAILSQAKKTTKSNQTTEGKPEKRSWWKRIWGEKSKAKNLDDDSAPNPKDVVNNGTLVGGIDVAALEAQNEDSEAHGVSDDSSSIDQSGADENSALSQPNDDIESPPPVASAEKDNTSSSSSQDGGSGKQKSKSQSSQIPTGEDIPEDPPSQEQIQSDDGEVENSSDNSSENEEEEEEEEVVALRDQPSSNSASKATGNDQSSAGSQVSDSIDSLGEEDNKDSLGEVDDVESIDIEVGKRDSVEYFDDKVYKDKSSRRGMMCTRQKICCTLLCCIIIAGAAVAVLLLGLDNLFSSSSSSGDDEMNSPGYIGDDDFFYEEDIVVSPGVITTKMAELTFGCDFGGDEEFFPHVFDQCLCDDQISTVPQDVAEMRETLIDALSNFFFDEQPFSEVISSCDPSNMALIWLASGENRDSGDLRQRFGLANAFFAMDGSLWDRSQGWLSEENECYWEGSLCGNDVVVNRLVLDDNNLFGEIPLEIIKLHGLKKISFEDNSLSGSIPPDLLGMERLEELNLADNSFSGSLPVSAGASLRTIDLHFNKLKGSIPPAIGGMSQLRKINLSFNELSGKIPPEFGSIESLEDLELEGNSLSGPIPASFGDLSNMVNLTLSDNPIAASIPARFGLLTNLQRLRIADAGLVGSLPTELGRLLNLKVLELTGNELSGRLPTELGELQQLFYLDLSENALTGQIPPEYRSMVSIEEILFERNDLDGIINADICRLRDEKLFRFSVDCNVGCPIPSCCTFCMNF